MCLKQLQCSCLSVQQAAPPSVNMNAAAPFPPAAEEGGPERKHPTVPLQILHRVIPGMEVPGPDSDWRSPQFRQKVVAQIEEAMRKAGTANTTHKSSNDMENHVYVKAKTREEYLSLVARLIIHFRDIHKKALGGPDPMNALTNLTGVGGGPGAIGMGPRPAGAPVGGMGAMGPMQIGQHAMAGVTGNPQSIGGPGQMPMQQMVQQTQAQQNALQFQQFQQAQQQNAMQQQQNAAIQQQFQMQQLRAQQQMQQQQQQHHQNQQLQQQHQNQQQQQAQNQQQQNQVLTVNTPLHNTTEHPHLAVKTFNIHELSLIISASDKNLEICNVTESKL
uniref:Mediator of RNA polymerase II transcription subunit 15 n=1 Tax=Stegastes partitus TaxID=144197 RepID=A0A3B5BFJ9_9TELE